jgi:BirA family biotin operon repressor/biotin-[acetyl-CoA-carboxylase] ligase
VVKNLSPSAITRGLKTSLIGQKVIYYPCVPSTMDAARQEARRGAKEGTVIIAREQTGGRGRLKRTWLSPTGNIALSLVLYPDIVYLPYLVMIASLAVVHSIEAVTGLKTQIKWPNDILIGGKKVCGILIENEVRGNRAAYAIIGIGINVDLNVADFTEISNTATSLNKESDRVVSRTKIIRSLLTELERLYLALPA